MGDVRMAAIFAAGYKCPGVVEVQRGPLPGIDPSKYGGEGLAPYTVICHDGEEYAVVLTAKPDDPRRLVVPLN